jgi:hypothetical protein
MSVVNLATGELLERITEQPSDVLSQALDAMYARQAEYTTMANVLQDELRARMRAADEEESTFGEYTVTREIKWTRQWDMDDLEGVLNDLAERKVIKATDASEIIGPPEPTLSGKAAAALLKRLDGEDERALRACFTWQKKEPAKLLVVHVNGGPDQQGGGGGE